MAGAASRWVLAFLLGSGSALVAAAPAQAAPLPTASCAIGAGSAADRAIAKQLKPLMNGRRLGSSVSGRAIACARVIVGIVQQRKLGPRAALIAMTTAVAESELTNHIVMVDHDSLGLFQQRSSQGWGRPDQLVDPAYATNAFLNAMLRKYPNGRWMSGDVGAICQKVQISARPAAYSPEVHDAALIVNALWSRPSTPAPATGSATTPQAVPVPAPTGPFQKTLATAQVQTAGLEGRHALQMADWNADGKPDLLVVTGAGAATGRTEVRIMDGASNFLSLLLVTATTLGPTDERHAYAFTDWNGDKKPDLVVTQRSGTASGRTEIRIVDGASNFQQVLLDTATGLAATDDRYQFAVADWTGDGRADLVVAQTAGTKSGKAEVQVLDGASTFQTVAPVVTSGAPVGPGTQIAVTDWNADRRPDLVTLQKGSVQAWDGAAGMTRSLARASVAADGKELVVTDWNADGHPDLAAVKTAGSTSGLAEVSILGG
ncbi:hypothetical protein BJY16_006659 [Actinoplanes octamycinicus]|uniref:VCBS repeat protein n=1 Tax=Actinoplanes octamycinicus TaxID=135948 RepID=A0A7W7H3C4_9ACTN|nr:VCBS repeat-containing protein [Actinoplanes octamycinicus]MBB4743200.1 hypothetical protein [Actinoplanes octamycinicus]GIE61236.1 hypothetical protein Aoc01nite_66380 [Actinoplanes octamycinicus]